MATPSKISVSPARVTLGNAVSFRIKTSDTSFTHTIKLTVNGHIVNVATRATTQTVSYTTTKNTAAYFPNALSNTALVTCYTYNANGTLVGTTTANLQLECSADMVPTISKVQATEQTDGVQAKFAALLQGKSTLSVAITAAGSYGSTVTEYSTTIDGAVYLGSSFTTGVLRNCGTLSMVTTVRDSRGRTATSTKEINVVEYFPPRIAALKASRINTAGVSSDAGTRLVIDAAYAIAPAGNKNDHTFEFSYKVQGASSFTTLKSGTAPWSYSDVAKYLSAPELSADNAYVVKLTISDFYSTVSYETLVPTSFTLLDFRNTGKGMAIGKASEKDAFEVAMPAEFSGGVKYNYLTRDSIEANADVDDYYVEGHYACSSNQDAATVANSPTDIAFTLDVESATGLSRKEAAPSSHNKRQVIRDYLGNTFVRRGNNDHAWFPWRQIEGVGTSQRDGTISVRCVDGVVYLQGSRLGGAIITGGDEVDAGTIPEELVPDVGIAGACVGWNVNGDYAAGKVNVAGRSSANAGRVTVTLGKNFPSCTSYQFQLVYPLV